MKIRLKDRVKLKAKSPKKEKGTVVKLYRKGNSITVGVLWDSHWPETNSYKGQPGHVFYYKPEDVKIVDTWNIDWVMKTTQRWLTSPIIDQKKLIHFPLRTNSIEE